LLRIGGEGRQTKEKIQEKIDGNFPGISEIGVMTYHRLVYEQEIRVIFPLE